ncbi:MAG: hypothetical protein ACT4PI_18190 [Actinomycetota bacterium]
MTARARRGVLGIAASLALLAACGGASGGISEETSRSLGSQVQAVRQSAQSFDPAGVERGLAELRASVAQLKADGELDDERAAEILAAAADVEAQIDVVPTTTTAPPPPPVEDDDDDKKGKGKGGDDD